MIRLPLGSTDLDAFSLSFADHPVIVLGTNKNDRARSRFDGAHELAHLVLHGDRPNGQSHPVEGSEIRVLVGACPGDSNAHSSIDTLWEQGDEQIGSRDVR